jgi:hypothetical protein
MFNKVYAIIGVLALAAYAAIGFTGYEFGDPEREFVPADVRQSPGGYRSFDFWHSGYRGGK